MSARGGFTVVEMLVALGSSLLILAAVGGFATAERHAFDRQLRHLQLRETSRRVLGAIARELRAAGFAPVSGSFDGARDGLAVAESERLELRGDFHGATSDDAPDGQLDVDSDERLGFVLNGARGVVSETIGRQTLPLTIDGVVPAHGLAVHYFDACGAEITAPRGGALDEAARRRVQRIAIGLTVRSSNGEALTNQATALLRNRQALRCD